MNCADNYNDVLLYLKQAERDINEAFEHASFKKHVLPKIEENISLKDTIVESTQEKDKTPEFDPEDIHLNFQLLLEVNEAIRSDLSELLAKHNLNDLNEDDFSDYKFRRNSSSLSRYKDLNGYHQDDSGVSANGCHFDDDEKSFSELDALSDLGSHSPSTISTVHVATQTTPSPSASSTNLSWVSSSDTESSEGDAWASKPPRWTSGKSNSAPVLEKVFPSSTVNRQSRSQSDRHLAEIEANEACKWLRAAGFPQYAQMYEDALFPVDLEQAELDHVRLDNDLLRSLFRRLKILNNCVSVNQQRLTHSDESDEEPVALSENWSYQSDVRRWSRTGVNKGVKANIDEVNKQLESCQNKDAVIKADKSSAEKSKQINSTKQRKRNLNKLEVGHASDSPIHQTPRASSFDKNETLSQPATEAASNIWEKVENSPSLDSTTSEAGTSSLPYNDGVSFFSFPAIQFQFIIRLALLKLTAYMEKYSPSHRTGFTWNLSKFFRKIKTPAYKDKNVFGVPISVTLQRTGQLLPRNIEEALRWLELNATDQVGIFRKPGVKSRIIGLKNIAEAGKLINFLDQQAFDVADMLKLYFRELPEALLTNKMSDTFLTIFQCVPEPQRHEAVLCALLLLPNEHMEVLKILLRFLVIIANSSDVNQMNESNLSMCFAPSLFSYSSTFSKSNTGTPTAKELAENKAGYECLFYFLTNYDNLFKVPHEFLTQCGQSEIMEKEAKYLNNLSSDEDSWKSYMAASEVSLFKEAKERNRSWVSIHSFQPYVDIAYKKLTDGIPLRFWKVSVEIEAPPAEVLHRILRERHIWDPDLRAARIVAQFDQRKEIFQYVRGENEARPSEEYCVLRSWRTDLYKCGCLLVESSVEHPDVHKWPNSVRGMVLASRYLIEPCGSGKSRLIHLSRIDTMGRSPEWNHKYFGHMQAMLMANIQHSFLGYKHASGPESKV